MKKKIAKSKIPTDISIEFLVETLVSIRSTLLVIGKESSAKTEALSELSSNVILLMEMNKSFHESMASNSEKISNLQNQIKIFEVGMKSLDSAENFKDVKLAIQIANNSLFELKTIREIERKSPDKKKWKALSFLQDVFSGIKDFKISLAILLLIMILITLIFFGPNTIHLLIDILKKIV